VVQQQEAFKDLADLGMDGVDCSATFEHFEQQVRLIKLTCVKDG
jgi:hypothetical protein